MLSQILIPLLSTVIGGVLVIVGNYFAHRLINSAEKRKVIRQKIEEMYILTNQMEAYSTKRALEQAVLPPAEFTKKYLTSNNYLFFEDNIIEQMRMLASFYVPKITKNIDEYKLEINRANRRIEQELDPKGRNAHTLEHDNKYESTAISVHNDIANVNNKLRTTLSKVIPKY
jgi:hypothetical protein